MAFRSRLGGDTMSFEVRDGQIVDTDTQSTWRVDGMATDGPLAGMQLEPVSEAYVAFWFAWAAFNEGTDVWTTS